MGRFFRIQLESIRQALQALKANKMRTFLSLLGIMIGIFCIISVLSAVNSLEQSIKSGFGELGNDVLIIDVMPWDEDPGDNYWTWIKRPFPSYDDYEDLKRRLPNFEKMAYATFVAGKTVKYRSSSVQGGFLLGASYDFPEVQNIEIEKGRYFTEKEYRLGSNKVILGASVVESLFPNGNFLDKYVKIFGQKFQIIGVTKAEGDNPFNMINYDETIWLGYHTAKKFINTKNTSRFSASKFIYVKAKPDQKLEELEGEITSVMRAIHRLKPAEDDDFAINKVSALNNLIDNVFGVVYFAGGLIGVFALIVGMFSVANIMFVSVRERTNIIGVKKALGAKSNVILLEFLIESVVLCIIGGLLGLILVIGVLKLCSMFLPFEIAASPQYILLGVGVSILVGIISGIIPAFMAAKMDPVEAIRK